MGRTFTDMHVGLKFRSPSHQIQQDEALEFAQRFDPQPFHTDEQQASASIFKGLVVSGWYTASRVFSLVLRSSIDLEGGIVGQCIEDLQWLAPVRLSDTLTVESEVVHALPSPKDPNRGVIVLKSVAVNQANKPVFSMHAHILAPAPTRAPR